MRRCPPQPRRWRSGAARRGGGGCPSAPPDPPRLHDVEGTPGLTLVEDHGAVAEAPPPQMTDQARQGLVIQAGEQRHPPQQLARFGRHTVSIPQTILISRDNSPKASAPRSLTTTIPSSRTPNSPTR